MLHCILDFPLLVRKGMAPVLLSLHALALFQMLDLLMHMMDCVVSQAGRLNDCNKDSTLAFI
jgi:hypothetical protein